MASHGARFLRSNRSVTRDRVVGRVASPTTVVPLAWLTSAVLRRREGATSIALGTSLAALASTVLALGAPCLGIVVINAERIAANDHWPTDVLAGDLLGLGGVCLASIVLHGQARRADRRLACER